MSELSSLFDFDLGIVQGQISRECKSFRIVDLVMIIMPTDSPSLPSLVCFSSLRFPNRIFARQNGKLSAVQIWNPSARNVMYMSLAPADVTPLCMQEGYEVKPSSINACNRRENAILQVSLLRNVCSEKTPFLRLFLSCKVQFDTLLRRPTSTSPHLT